MLFILFYFFKFLRTVSNAGFVLGAQTPPLKANAAFVHTLHTHMNHTVYDHSLSPLSFSHGSCNAHFPCIFVDNAQTLAQFNTGDLALFPVYWAFHRTGVPLVHTSHSFQHTLQYKTIPSNVRIFSLYKLDTQKKKKQTYTNV